MATYTYTTNADEDGALAIELMKTNGQLAGQGQQPVDLQGLFALFVAEKLSPLRVQFVQAQMTTLIQAVFIADQPTRDKIYAAVQSAVPSKPPGN